MPLENQDPNNQAMELRSVVLGLLSANTTIWLKVTPFPWSYIFIIHVTYSYKIKQPFANA